MKNRKKVPTFEKVTNMIEKAQAWAVSDCICRWTMEKAQKTGRTMEGLI